jgi:isocitrate dehydrogenase (NAD+)
VAKKYPNIELETMIVDNTCMQLVSRPQQFDVMVMPNLYGNIVANVATGLIGGAGLVSGSNYGEGCALFEAGTRNSGKGLAGQNSANPAGMLFAAANLLKFIGLVSYLRLFFFGGA